MADNNPIDQSLQLHPSLSYESPPQTIAGQINYVRFQPINASPFLPANDIIFRIQSSNEFVNVGRSYIKLTWQETDIPSSGGVTSALSSSGATAFINSVLDTVGGNVLPVYRYPNHYQSYENKTATYDRQCNLFQQSQTLLNPACCTSGTDARKSTTTGSASLTGTANGASAREFTSYIPVCSYLATSTRALPLCVINGGWEHRITLEQYNYAFAQYNTGSSYKITSAEFHAAMVKPSDMYLQDLKRELDLGSSIKIPVQFRKWYQVSLGPSGTQSIKLQTSFLNSLDSILIDHKAQATAVPGVDNFYGNSLTQNISSFFTVISGVRYPRTFDINSQKVASDGSGQNQMLLSSFETRYGHVQLPKGGVQGTTPTDAFLFYSFEATGEAYQGISTSDGYIELDLIYGTQAPSNGDPLNCFFNYSGTIIISEGGSVVNAVW